ncbi:MAG: bL20 family ribosomal protein, partial [Desulfobacterales bacterium]|nr:bL20 family ribosomal protein [Desulfobacterales bacterium]
MPRVKRSLTAHKKRRKILKAAKGFFLSRSKLLQNRYGGRKPRHGLRLPGPEGSSKRELGAEERHRWIFVLTLAIRN